MNEKINVAVSASDPAQRQKVYRWRVFRVADGMIFPSTYLVSKETSVQSWVAPNQWKFDSFTHVDLDLDGFVGLYSTSYTSVVATPSIFGSTTYNDSGKMNMNFTLKISIVGCPLENNIPVNTNQTWNVNE